MALKSQDLLSRKPLPVASHVGAGTASFGCPYNDSMLRWLVFLLLASALTAQTTDPARFDFATASLPNGMVGHQYLTTIKMRNGAGPFEFRLADGALPPGLHLDPKSGDIGGIPLQVGTFKFSISVRDVGTNLTAHHTFAIAIQSQLLLEWLKPPTLSSNTISGAVKVTNSSDAGETFDMTVIIVAVNEVGKAFALGYQRFSLAQHVEQVIPFSSTVPNGRYIVHADAIAGEPNKTKSSARASLETAVPLVVNVNR